MIKRLFLLVSVVWLLSACTQRFTPASDGTPGEIRLLRVMVHDSFSVSEDVMAQFEAEHNAKVQFLESGDAGTTLNKAILSKNNPLADVLYGVDNTFLSRALQEDIFEVYNSPMLAEVPAEFLLDPMLRALPIDYGDVCLNYDITYFNEHGLTPPTHLDDLLKPEFRGLLAVENPATSSPGLAFLLTTVSTYGEDGYLDYWRKLVANDALVVNDWSAAYYSEFTHSGGTRPIIVSYSSSPPAEIIYAEQPIDSPSTAAVTSDGTCFRQIEFAGILKGTHNRDLAELWIDFMLSLPFQEDIPLQMLVFPVNSNAKLPDVFTNFATIPTLTAQINPEDITAHREQWIADWTEAVLR